MEMCFQTTGGRLMQVGINSFLVSCACNKGRLYCHHLLDWTSSHPLVFIERFDYILFICIASTFSNYSPNLTFLDFIVSVSFITVIKLAENMKTMCSITVCYPIGATDNVLFRLYHIYK